MSQFSSQVFALLLFAAVASAGDDDAAAPEKNVEQAREHYDRGLQLYNDEAYDSALAEFERAYQLAPNYKILYNVGLLHRQLNDYAAAMQTLRRYLADGADNIAAQRRSEVEKTLTQLELRVGTLEIVTNVPDVEIAVDDVVVGRSPLPRPVIVTPGRRKVSASHDGYSPVSKMVTVAATDALRVNVEMRSLVMVPPAPHPESANHALRDRTYVAWGITGATAVGALVTGVVAANAANRLEQQLNTLTTASEVNATRSKVVGFATASDILTVTTVIGAGVSGFFTYQLLREQRRPMQSTPQATLQLVPSGIWVVGRF